VFIVGCQLFSGATGHGPGHAMVVLVWVDVVRCDGRRRFLSAAADHRSLVAGDRLQVRAQHLIKSTVNNLQKKNKLL